MTDPDHLDFRLAEDSPAKGYGCETFYIPVEVSPKPEKQYPVRLDGSMVSLGGIITENTLVTSDTVFVTDNVIIENNITLNISAGTLLLFTGPYGITVQGTLLSEGTAADRIIYTSLKQDPYDEYVTNEYSWNGIIFDNTLSTNDSSMVKYSVFEYSKTINELPDKMSNYLGGAIFINRFSKLKIENNVFRFNTALYGAAIAAVNNSQPAINNNLFYQNYAKYNGSVAYFINSSPYFYNNTLIDNVISELNPDYQMGAVYNFRSKPLFVNNIIRDNATGAFPQVYFFKEYFMHHNDITGFDGFNGNFDADPLFDNTQELPGVLLQKSPCIDAGTDMGLIQPEYDLAGNPRAVNGIVDAGAFEDQTSTMITHLPSGTGLLNIYPNPGNPGTRITFNSDRVCEADIFIYDVKGTLLEKNVLVNAVKGDNSYDLTLERYAAGLYIIKVIMPEKILQGKFLLLK